MVRNPYTVPPLRYRDLRPQMRLQMTKSVQNGQNDPKWHLRDAKGHFGSFWGHFGAQVLKHSQMCPILLIWKPLRPVFVLCWLDFRQFLVVWVFWGSSGALMGNLLRASKPFLDLLATIWAYFGGKVPPTRGCWPCLGAFSKWPLACPKGPAGAILGPFWTLLVILDAC